MEDPELNTENLCRACGQQVNSTDIGKPKECVNIFETTEFLNKLSTIISKEFCSTIKSSKFVCNCCVVKVNEFYGFREMCLDTMRSFGGLLRYQGPLPFKASMKKNKLILKERKCMFRKKETHGSQEQGTESTNKFEDKAETSNKIDTDKDEVQSHSPLKKNEHVQTADYAKTKIPKSKKVKASKTNATATEAKLYVIKAKSKSIYRCEICSTRFSTEYRLIAHNRKHKGLPPYLCTQTGCDKSFNHSSELSKHLQKHNGIIFEFACNQKGCKKVYKQKSALIFHKRRYHNLKREFTNHVCEFCGKVLKNVTLLKEHRYNHKDKSELPFVCDQPNCLLRFSNKDKLNIHLRRHADTKNYVCPHCGIRKTTRIELKVHINYHTLGVRSWSCRFCKQVFQNSGNLKTHVRIVHESFMTYSCRYCDRKFDTSERLKYHEMVHTGEKPNKCVECGKGFILPSSLRAHIKVHEPQRE